MHPTSLEQMQSIFSYTTVLSTYIKIYYDLFNFKDVKSQILACFEL